MIASSFTLDSSSLKTEHSSTFYGAIYRRWHSLHCSVLLVRFVTHKFVLQTLPLTVINPQTFSSNSGEEIKRVVKVTCVLSPRIMRLTFIQAQHLSSSLPSAVSSEIVLPPPRKSIIDQYRCNFTEMSSISYGSPSPIPFFSAVSENTGGENIVGENIVSESSDKNSDPDAATSHAWGAGEAAKDAVASKQRRQQNRLEVVDAFATSLCIRTFSYRPFSFFQSDKVAKKPKPHPQAPLSAPCLPDQDQDEKVAESLVKVETKDEQKSCFVGDVLYTVRRYAANYRIFVLPPCRGRVGTSTAELLWLGSWTPSPPATCAGAIFTPLKILF